jgi:hypothetical protein
MTKLQSGHELSGDAQTDGQTDEVGTLFLDATHSLDVVDICSKLFQNLFMYDKVTLRTRIKWGRTDGRTDRRTR